MRHAALLFLISVSLAAIPARAVDEPDGSRPIGTVPPFSGEPAPPAWLRASSHAVAFVDTRHYLYEVYGAPDPADPRGFQWIVRYVMLPEGNEAFRELEQIFLFDNNPKHKAKDLKPGDLAIDPGNATWKKVQYKLVDRRDLMLP